MSDNKVAQLHERNNDSRSWSIEQMLESTLKEIREGKIDPNKALLLLLKNDEDTYRPMYRGCNLKASEAIALLEISKEPFIAAHRR